MQFFSQYKLYLFLGVAVVIAIGAWFVLSEPSQEELTTTSVNGSGVDKDLVGTLLQLRTVSLSGTVFSDPAFQSLQDFGTQIIPEPVGRPNPFAPASYRPTSTASGNKLFPAR
ncbi:hypothetical protein HY417_01535 [Candidatus Kaiserbacteria bacterium]|nr:hypothetical protein [Candidatus Kaiserbacteria bacterium]